MTDHNNSSFKFQDRAEAGMILANRLKPYGKLGDVVVLALPRGGVPVGLEIARALNAPISVLIVRKLGVPGHEELAIGTVASGGSPAIDTSVANKLHLSERVINSIVRREKRRLARNEDLYSARQKRPDLNGKIVILADDGATTGSTLALAAQSVREQGASEIIVAVPVAPPSAVSMLNKTADQVVCLMEPRHFVTVAHWYQEFEPLTDKLVCEQLEHSLAECPKEKSA